MRSKEARDLGVKHASIASSVFIAKLISLLLGAIMLIVVARVLGSQQYGIYTVALAIAGFAGAFGSLNFGAYFNREIPLLLAKNKKDGIGIRIVDALLFLIAVSIILTVVSAIMLNLIAGYFTAQYEYLGYVYIALLSIGFAITYPILTAILVSFGSNIEVAIALVSFVLVQTIISILLVLIGFGPLGAILGYIAGLVTAVLVPLYYIRKHVRLRIRLSGIKARLVDMLKFSLPITLTGLLNTILSTFPVIFLGILLVSTSVIGQYGLATRIGNVIDLVAGSISTVLIPMFANAIQKRRAKLKLANLYQSSLFFGLIFSVPMIAYSSVLSYQIIITVFTSAYELTVIYMPLISVGVLLSIFAGYSYSLLVSMGKVVMALKYTSLAIAAQFISILILGYFFQVIGVIVAYFYIGNVILALLYTRGLNSLGIKIDVWPLIRVVICGAIFGISLLPLLLLPIRPLYILALGLVEGFIVYPIVLVKMRALNLDEIQVLHKVGDSVPFIGRLLNLTLRYTESFI